MPLRQFYTYRIPSELEADVKSGMRIVVQFGAKRFYSAIVRHLRSTEPQHETKDIITILDKMAIVTEQQLVLWDWIAEYYLCSVGEVMKASLPSALKLESETYLFFNNEFDAFDSLSTDELIVAKIVQSKQKIQIDDIVKLSGKRTALSIIKSLAEKNALYIDEAIKERYRAKTEAVILVSGDLSSADYVNKTYVLLS